MRVRDLLCLQLLLCMQDLLDSVDPVYQGSQGRGRQIHGEVVHDAISQHWSTRFSIFRTEPLTLSSVPSDLKLR
jgi:hypothetical protein